MLRYRKNICVTVVMGFLLLFLSSASSALATGGKIDINKATVKELQKLEGIGKTIAHRIVEHRKNDPFKNIDEIRKIKGIGKVTFEKIKEHITIGEEKAEALQK